METRKLASEYREKLGKGPSRRMRAEGHVPAVLYGLNEETIPIWIKEPDLRKLLMLQWETAIVDLKVDGKVKKECNAIIKDIQQHPASGKVLHVDFQHIRKGQKIRLVVPITLVGTPRGVKDMGGILEHGLREASVRCLPKHIPDVIEIDVSGLGIQDSIPVKSIFDRFPDVEFLDDPESTLANVLPPKVEVEAVVEEEEAVEEPEVIAKGKEDEDSKGKEKEEKEKG